MTASLAAKALDAQDDSFHHIAKAHSMLPRLGDREVVIHDAN